MSSSTTDGEFDPAVANGHRLTWFAPERPIDGGTVFRTHGADYPSNCPDPLEVPTPTAPSA